MGLKSMKIQSKLWLHRNVQAKAISPGHNMHKLSPAHYQCLIIHHKGNHRFLCMEQETIFWRKSRTVWKFTTNGA